MKDRAHPPTVAASPDGEGVDPARVVRLFGGILAAAAGVSPEVRARFADDRVCRRCGVCCHLAIRIHGRMVLLKDLPCKYLAREPDGRALCKVYHLRDLTGFCHKIEAESIKKELYPPDCPYIAGVPGYGGKIALSGQEYREIVPILRKIFNGFPPSEAVEPAVWARFLRSLGL